MDKEKNRLREVRQNDWTMNTLWAVCMTIGLGLLGILVYKVATYEENPVIIRRIKPTDRKLKVVPHRGDILDCKDRLLDLAAAAMRAALLVQEKHSAKDGADS